MTKTPQQKQQHCHLEPGGLLLRLPFAVVLPLRRARPQHAGDGLPPAHPAPPLACRTLTACGAQRPSDLFTTTDYHSQAKHCKTVSAWQAGVSFLACHRDGVGEE